MAFIQFLLQVSFVIFLVMANSPSLAQATGKPTPCENYKNFYKKDKGSVYCLEEVVDSKQPVKGLYLRTSDFMSSYYGELSLMDSILKYHKTRLVEKLRSTKNLYVESYVPEPMVEVLAEANGIEKLMLQPKGDFYTNQQLQQLQQLGRIKKINYVEGADSSLAFVQCLQQWEQLDTLVWLDDVIENIYLDQLTTISTFIIDKHPITKRHYRGRPLSEESFTLPAHLTRVQANKLVYWYLAKALQNCTQLTYLEVASEVLIDKNTEELKINSSYFPPPLPQLKKLEIEGMMKKLPAYINQFSALESLKLLQHYYPFTLPSSFYELSNLKELEITLKALPDSICQLQQLEDLVVNFSPIKPVPIPSSIACLHHLERLKLVTKNSAPRYYIPLNSAVYELSNLKDLYLQGYYITDSIKYLSQLERLRLSQNVPLPDSLIHLKSLTMLDLSACILNTYPEQIYHFRMLDTLLLNHALGVRIKFLKNGKKKVITPLFSRYRTRLNARRLKALHQLKYLEFGLAGVKNEVHYRKIYKALPENCLVKMQEEWRDDSPTPGFNVGLYMDYGWQQAVFTGLELLYHFAPQYQTTYTKKAGRFQQQAIDRKTYGYKYYNPFYFHSLHVGVEWNYLRSPKFLMGYKIGYSYARVREPIALQLDMLAYTNYNHAFDWRVAPKVLVTLYRNSGVYIYASYSYKFPLLAHQEQALVARHNLGLNVRLTYDWSDGIVPVVVGF